MRLVIPEEGRRHISVLLGLSPEKIDLAEKILWGDRTANDLLPRLQKEIGLVTGDAVGVWTATWNIVAQRGKEGISDDEILTDLSELAPDDFAKASEETKRALLKLLASTEERFLAEKSSELRTAMVRAFSRARTICEVRPVFDRKRETVKQALLVVLLGIDTFDEDHEHETFVVQLSRDGLKRLKETVEDAERKLETLEKTFRPVVELK